jgi:hypothetical protein
MVAVLELENSIFPETKTSIATLMTSNRFMIWMLLIVTFSCNQRKDVTHNSTHANADTSTVPIQPSTDTTVYGVSESELYAFMQFVVQEQKLNVTYGLNPILDVEEDTTFFQSLLETQPKEVAVNSGYSTDSVREGKLRLEGELKMNFPAMSLSSRDLLPRLQAKDLPFIRLQQKRYSSFQWNLNRLKFNLNNRTNWYSFSLPCFSKDKTKVIVTIRDYCPGLCGGGKTIVFTKTPSGWKSHMGPFWIH